MAGTLIQRLNEVFRAHVDGLYAVIEALAALLDNQIRIPQIIDVSSGGGSPIFARARRLLST